MTKGITYYLDPKTNTLTTENPNPTTSNQAHYFIPDSMNTTWHPANGKRYESKSTFRKVTRDHGCVEVGNEEQKQRPPEPKDSDYEKAVLQAWDNPQKNHVDRSREFNDTVISEVIEKARK